MTALVPPGMQQAAEADAEQGMSAAGAAGKQPDALTPREEQVLALRWAYPEATQADLALLLGGITDRMVRNYLASAMDKLGAQTTLAAIRTALRRRIIGTCDTEDAA